MVKHLLTLVLFLTGGMLVAQTTNKSWSIDYLTWNTTGQPALYIDCGNDDAFNGGEELTLEVWARAYTFAENRKMMGKLFYEEPIANGYVLGFENLHVYAEFFNPSVQQVPRPGDGPMPADSSMVHIVSTYSALTGQIKSYVNGNLAGETTMFPSAAIVANDRPFIIGNAPWDMLSYQFYGDMDEVRVWNTVRSQEQIREAMHHQLLGNEAGLTAYYNFNEAEGALVPDGGTHHFDGTLANFDHESTSWALSAAPVGDEIMATMQDVGAIWYRNSENYHKLITNNGILVIGNIPVKDFRKYLVVGQNGLDGVASTFEPVTQPAGFIRTNREWYMNKGGEITGSITFTMADAGAGVDFPVNADLTSYALLYRKNSTDNFRAIAHPTIPIAGIFQFNNTTFTDGYYAIGYSTEEFVIQGPDGVQNTAFQTLEMAPNPVFNQLLLSGLPNNTRLSIYNINGAIMGQYSMTNGINNINLSELKSGMYFLQFDFDGQQAVKKMIKN